MMMTIIKALRKRQEDNDKNKDTLKDPTVIHTGSMLAVQRVDGGVVTEHDTQDNSGNYTRSMWLRQDAS